MTYSKREREAIIAAYAPTIPPAEALRRFREYVAEGIEDLERYLYNGPRTIRRHT